jgi:hypothetical protein
MVKRYTALSTVRLTSGRGDTVVVKSHVPETIILAADHDSLASRHARAIEALRGCVEAVEHLTHGVRDKDAEGNILAAARAVIAEEGKS